MLAWTFREPSSSSRRTAFRGDATKRFYHSSELPPSTRANLSLSLDVVYHLVEDETFDQYMHNLFEAADRFVIVYASNVDRKTPEPHVRHREFTHWVAANRPDFSLIQHIPNEFPFDARDPENTSFADFYVFERS